MVRMCKLLHMLPVEDLDEYPTSILDTAVLIDKYDCVEATQLPMQGVLLSWLVEHTVNRTAQGPIKFVSLQIEPLA